MLYRILRTLRVSEGKLIMEGGFISGALYTPQSLAKLEEVGAIAQLHAPPLLALPGFEAQTKRLEGVGIIEADQLIESDAVAVAQQLAIDAATVRRWQNEVSDWLIVPVRAGG